MRWRQGRTTSSSARVLGVVLVALALTHIADSRRNGRRTGGGCGLSCYRWRKCKDNLSVLTSVGGSNRPGQAGTSGQLFFTKCGDPPNGCPCTYEPKTEKPKPELPKFDKAFMDYVEDDAQQWLETVMEVF